MGIFTLVLVVLWILKSLFLTAGARQALTAGQQVSLDLLTLLLAIPAVYYVWKLFLVVRKRLLWKIRRRLILAHIFVGVIPLLLVLVILYVSGLLFYYQLSYYLISNQIGTHSAAIHAFNSSLSAGLEQAISGAPVSLTQLRTAFDRDAKYLLGEYPSACIILRVQDLANDRTWVHGNKNVNVEQLKDYQIPRWTWGREFSGLVMEDTQAAVYRSATAATQTESRERLFLRSLVFSDIRPDMRFSLEVSVPFDRYLLDQLKAALGLDLLLADHVAVTGLNVMLMTTDMLQQNTVSATFDEDRTQQAFGRPVWSIRLFPVSWNSGIETTSTESQILFVELSTARLIQNVFRSESNVSRTILGVLQIVVGFFLVVEVVSLVIGILLTKSITNAVHALDRGTGFVRRGDFSHRIVVRSDDQLGGLAKSFNQMTEYVQALVKERVEKERLERELEIAKEVQEQLFPRAAPQMGKMELTGLCLPARVVSGDYYDFLQLNVRRMGMALGDICGKGISAALLMANLQATLRSNVFNLARATDRSMAGGPVEDSVAGVVKLLNEQIYNYTSANKYASFFYAVYDDTYPSLTYCNAGHNPPLYFNDHGFQRLETGGTVVGIFPDADYEQETIHFKPGDLFLAYTDGIVESVNEYGEEFGEDRLVKLVQEHRHRSADEIQRVIVDEVLRWAYEEERDDDMTLVVGKIR